MEDDSFRSFISKVRYFQELRECDKVKVWMKTPPKWLPQGQQLYLYTTKFKGDTLKGMYYCPNYLQFFVDEQYEIQKIKFVLKKETKCVIL